MPEPIRLAVRAVAEFLLQSGSIDNRYGGADRAVLGSRIHRMLQKQAGGNYQPEVSLSLPITHEGTDFLLEGRADGIFQRDGVWTVDEIKTVGAPIEMIDENFNAAHWGQAMCYAHILAVTRKLPEAAVQLTYFQVDTGEIRRFSRTKAAGELEQFVRELLSDYQKWTRFQTEWASTRTASIQSCPFPFSEYRRGQREMAVASYRTIQQRGRLFCQAPTGIGKTVSALFPSVKAMGEGLAERIFYLTAKTITRQAAEDAFSLLREQGLRMKTVTLTAKDKICFLEERDCNPDACTYANGYYDRIRDCLFELLGSADRFTREVIEQAAGEWQVCPFELSLDLSSWCDGIICDYNYLFDPVANLQRFFGEQGGEYVFLIDEAHNLVDRARDMYSAPLSKSGILSLKNAVAGAVRSEELGRSLRELNSQLVGIRKSCGEEGWLVQDKPEEALTQAVSRFCAAASEWLEQNREPTPLRKQVLEQYFEGSFFLRILELFDEHYCFFASTGGARSGDVTVRLLCLDPSALLDGCLSKGRSAIFFSATLSPLDYYREVLGGGTEAKRLLLRSPFPQENLCLLSAGRIRTFYRDREDSLLPIARMLHALISGKRGNYLAYFPSYRYLQDVYDVFQEEYPDVETVVQNGSMDEAEREDFLLRFDSENEETLLGFCVLGGVFGEGVDLKGDRLIGTAVVGVGLPQIGPELDLLRDYYNRRNGMGFEYAYRYPGMNKVLQAAGRVIRGPEDRGVVLLIDSRFPSPDYQCLFPDHWGHWQRVDGEEELRQKLERFWG